MTFPSGKINRGALYAALTGRTDTEVSGRGDNIRGMLLAVGGASDRTRSGIDLTAAAKKLGRDRRTLERWVKKADGGLGSSPSTKHLKDLKLRSRQAATTQAGRKSAVKGNRDQLTAERRKVSLAGKQGITRAGQTYIRDTTTETDVSPEQLDAMLNAYEQGGDQGFLKWATAHWDEEYIDGWGFVDISEIEIR